MVRNGLTTMRAFYHHTLLNLSFRDATDACGTLVIHTLVRRNKLVDCQFQKYNNKPQSGYIWCSRVFHTQFSSTSQSDCGVRGRQ